ncbi:hypothetical protein GCM10023350_03830 [Nocardioides endophyticus]|uniref:Uncharacterized protein n=1 Tax=Nocardioides endophyticus TaxID=1353775 RepID=A0ABP8YBU4_9ACTN
MEDFLAAAEFLKRCNRNLGASDDRHHGFVRIRPKKLLKIENDSSQINRARTACTTSSIVESTPISSAIVRRRRLMVRSETP